MSAQERMEVRHAAVPGYSRYFFAVLAVSVIYLVRVFFTG
jgi:hypothetical protein